MPSFKATVKELDSEITQYYIAYNYDLTDDSYAAWRVAYDRIQTFHLDVSCWRFMDPDTYQFIVAVMGHEESDVERLREPLAERGIEINLQPSLLDALLQRRYRQAREALAQGAKPGTIITVQGKPRWLHDDGRTEDAK